MAQAGLVAAAANAATAAKPPASAGKAVSVLVLSGFIDQPSTSGSLLIDPQGEVNIGALRITLDFIINALWMPIAHHGLNFAFFVGPTPRCKFMCLAVW